MNCSPVLSVKLAHLDADNEQRRAVAARYDAALGGHGGIALPTVAPGASHVYHLYVVQIDDRDRVRDALGKTHAVGTGIHYPAPIHRQPAYERYVQPWMDLSATDAMAGRILSLPMYPQLPPAQVDRVCAALAQLL